MHDIEIALLVRLIESGECRHSVRAAGIIERLRLARWIEPSTRAGIWVVRVGADPGLKDRLDTLLPAWKDDTALLRQNGLDPLDPRSIHALPGLKAAHQLQGFVHRKTWNAATAAGSKKLSRLPSTATLTDDWSMRGRVNCRTLLETPHGDIDLGQMTTALTEFTIPERGWRLSTGLKGELPLHIVTVENLSPLVDMQLPPRTMLLFSQGSAGAAAVQMLRALPDATWLHFGDLDPPGISIGVRLAKSSSRPLSLYIPAFASEYLDRRLPVKRKWSRLPVDAEILRKLETMQSWLEQELFVLDNRLEPDLSAALQKAGKPSM